MGALTGSKFGFITRISEVIGYKSGLALSISDFVKYLADYPSFLQLFQEPFDIYIRIRSEEFEQLFSVILYKLGVIDSPVHSYLVMMPYKKDFEIKEINLEIGELFLYHFKKEIVEVKKTKADLTFKALLDEVAEKYGEEGIPIALGMINRLAANHERSPWNNSRYIDWKDTKELDELFKSENLKTLHGKYFDQRFINFLERNFNEIDNINWRKFEALAAEYLTESGFTVDIGPGRNDGGVDIRAWSQPDTELPPTLLVQCKRQKTKVDKVVVKSLWADMQEETAKTGLIVTSSAISPGAKKVSQVRNYNIQEANRETLKDWLKEMRTPGKGIFLGE